MPTRFQSQVWNWASPQPELTLARELQARLKGQHVVVAVRRAEPPPPRQRCGSMVYNRNPLRESVCQWLEDLGPDVRERLPCYADDLLRGAWRYEIYSPMLLLGASTFASAPWKLCLPVLSPYLETLYLALCKRLCVTHIAINAPIPLNLDGGPTLGGDPVPNVQRSPLALQTLHGSFGRRDDPPIAESFDRTLWASVTQQGIHQCFAPLHSMFAKGNVTEKARILHFPDVRKSTTIDLYAGIGYLAFPYAKAGAAHVLCWELNPWSVEGFRRGAARNKWSTRILHHDADVRELEAEPESGATSATAGPELWMFHEDNAHALRRVERLRHRIPPVRHVNCGLLPTSAAAWDAAVRLLDPRRGGWVHAHENVPFQDVLVRRGLIEAYLLPELRAARPDATGWVVRCEHVERVKTYAPGIWHCVFDVFVGPAEGAELGESDAESEASPSRAGSGRLHGDRRTVP